MSDGLLAIVESYRASGIPLTDMEVEGVYRHCQRKLDLMGIDDPGYMELLFPDEMHNFLFSRTVNNAACFGRTA